MGLLGHHRRHLIALAYSAFSAGTSINRSRDLVRSPRAQHRASIIHANIILVGTEILVGTGPRSDKKSER
jgi:hypothetical protein